MPYARFFSLAFCLSIFCFSLFIVTIASSSQLQADSSSVANKPTKTKTKKKNDTQKNKPVQKKKPAKKTTAPKASQPVQLNPKLGIETTPKTSPPKTSPSKNKKPAVRNTTRNTTRNTVPNTVRVSDKVAVNYNTRKTGLQCVINHQKITYTVDTGMLPVSLGTTKASMFYVAYTRENVKSKKDRPITFCINGGPGSSSVWLHLGGLSPKRVAIDLNKPNRKPFVLKENHFSILDKTDLVFIDPVSTGFSRGKTKKEAKSFHSFDSDLQALAEFVRLYITRSNRWASPKYFCGESYGGLRAGALPALLMQKHHLELDGVILLSAVLDFQTLKTTENNDLPYVLMLPSFAATAWHHKKLDATLQKNLPATLKQAEKFARGQYASALMFGDRVPKKRRQKVIKEFARLTGLSETYIDQADLRISMSQFAAELLRTENRTLGRYDGRFTSVVRDKNAERYSFDASSAKVFGQFSAAQKDYMINLGVRVDDQYEILTSHVYPWSYKSFNNRYVNVSGKLRSAILKNERLKVLVLCGHTDLATPYYGMVYSINHLRLPAEIRKKQIQFAFYPAGHMMYVDDQSMIKLKKDLDNFYDQKPR